MNNIYKYHLNKNLLKKVIVKIKLKRINIQEKVIVKTLLDNKAIGLIISLEFTRK